MVGQSRGFPGARPPVERRASVTLSSPEASCDCQQSPHGSNQSQGEMRRYPVDPGQRASPSWGGYAGIHEDAGSEMHPVNLPAYRPDFNADEAIRGGPGKKPRETSAWETRQQRGRRQAGSRKDWPNGTDEVRRRRRTVLQSMAASPQQNSQPNSSRPPNGQTTLVPV